MEEGDYLIIQLASLIAKVEVRTSSSAIVINRKELEESSLLLCAQKQVHRCHADFACVDATNRGGFSVLLLWCVLVNLLRCAYCRRHTQHVVTNSSRSESLSLGASVHFILFL